MPETELSLESTGVAELKKLAGLSSGTREPKWIPKAGVRRGGKHMGWECLHCFELRLWEVLQMLSPASVFSHNPQ